MRRRPPSHFNPSPMFGLRPRWSSRHINAGRFIVDHRATIADLRTDEGAQAMMRALLPDAHGLHNLTLNQYRAFAKYQISEEEWFASRGPERISGERGP